MKKVLLALVAATVLAPAAGGGGFATVGLSSLPPDDLAAGSTWAVDLTVLQHGKTPLEGVQPVVRLTRPDGMPGPQFPATATGDPGVYHVDVTFPTSGRWSYEIDDGFTQVHTYKPVEVGDAAAAADAFPTLPVGGLALALLGAAALFLLGRRLRGTPQPEPLRG